MLFHFFDIFFLFGKTIKRQEMRKFRCSEVDFSIFSFFLSINRYTEESGCGAETSWRIVNNAKNFIYLPLFRYIARTFRFKTANKKNQMCIAKVEIKQELQTGFFLRLFFAKCNEQECFLCHLSSESDGERGGGLISQECREFLLPKTYVTS